MAPKFKKADSFDEFTTEKLDVVQNRLLGDYNSLGIYSINKKVSAELVELKKVKKESYNNEFFCTAQTHSGRFIDFEISFKKNSETKLLVAELYVLEGVPKQGGRMMNVLKTPIGKFTSEVAPDFVDVALKQFNVVYNADDEGQNRKEVDDEYITKRNMLLSALDKLTADSYNVIYEDYFTQRINLLKATNNAYTKKILAIFNDEFNKISDFFLLDKKTKKVINYKAMNELLDKAFEDLYGLDDYAESEKDFKQRLLPILTMFISGAERISASAKKSVLDTVPKRYKDDMSETLLDMKQAEESRLNPEVKESNKDMIFKGMKGKMDRIKTTMVKDSAETVLKKPEDGNLVKDEEVMSTLASGVGKGKSVAGLTGSTPTQGGFGANTFANSFEDYLASSTHSSDANKVNIDDDKTDDEELDSDAAQVSAEENKGKSNYGPAEGQTPQGNGKGKSSRIPNSFDSDMTKVDSKIEEVNKAAEGVGSNNKDAEDAMGAIF